MQVVISIVIVLAILLTYFVGYARGYLFHCDSFGEELAGEKRATFLAEWRKDNHVQQRDMAVYFVNRGITRIVIYGLGRYYHEFKEDLLTNPFSDIYLADRNASYMSTDNNQRFYGMNEIKDLDFECIVVTSLAHFTEIRKELIAIGIDKPIVAYSDLVFNLTKENGL